LPRARVELATTARQEVEAHELEEEAGAAKCAKEREAATEWEMLRQLEKKERCHTSQALKRVLAQEQLACRQVRVHVFAYTHTHTHTRAHMQCARTSITHVHTHAHAHVQSQICKTEATKRQIKMLRYQVKFLVLLGVPKNRLPILSKKLPGGKKRAYTPQEFCDALGLAVDKFKAGKFKEELAPIHPLDSKLEIFKKSFRGGTLNAKMQKYLEEETGRIEALVEEVRASVRSGLVSLESLKNKRKETQKGKGKKRQVPSFEKGQGVWVVDEVDAADPDLGEDVQEATIFGEMARKKRWWQLEFGTGGLENRWDYEDSEIFTTKESATLHKLLV
jgi:hypothetical protein